MSSETIDPIEDGSAPGAGFLLVISGASGSGKSTVCRRLMESTTRYELSVSVTTRPPRGREKDGVEYTFTSEDSFQSMVEAGDLLEHAGVFGKRYGTPRRNLESAAARGKVLLLDIDVQGGTILHEQDLPGVWVWIEAPSKEELARRLRGRRTESDAQIARRLARADEEAAMARRCYDHFIINDSLEQAVRSIDALVESALAGAGDRTRLGDHQEKQKR